MTGEITELTEFSKKCNMSGVVSRAMGTCFFFYLWASSVSPPSCRKEPRNEWEVLKHQKGIKIFLKVWEKVEEELTGEMSAQEHPLVMSCFTKRGKWENFRHQLFTLMVHQPPKRPWKMLLEAGNRINTAAWRYLYMRQNLESAGGLKEGARQGLQHPGWDFANKQSNSSEPWGGNFLPLQWEKAEGELLMCWICGAIPAGQRLMASKELSTRNGAERVKMGAAGSILIIQTEILMRIASKVFELLWVDIQEAPLSLPAQVPVGQSWKIGLSWVKSREFKNFYIYFLNQALSKLVVPVFKSRVHHLRISLTFSWQLRKSCHSHHLGCRERQRNMQRIMCTAARLWSASESATRHSATSKKMRAFNSPRSQWRSRICIWVPESQSILFI